jgi:hypothetical protein
MVPSAISILPDGAVTEIACLVCEICGFPAPQIATKDNVKTSLIMFLVKVILLLFFSEVALRPR